MQYPIIDLITDAYINNGWTGLNVTEGKNLLEYCYSGQVSVNNYYYNDYAVSNNRLSEFHLIENIQYTLSFDADTTVEPFTISVGAGNGTYLTDIAGKQNNMNGRVYITFTINSSHIELGDILALRPIRYTSPTTYNFSINNVMLEYGDIATSYEPYVLPTTDIAHRLKLPLPHYFPHPVIDALQRAAAGTQTADDTEIMRHYLTPLGIGGI